MLEVPKSNVSEVSYLKKSSASAGMELCSYLCGTAKDGVFVVGGTDLVSRSVPDTSNSLKSGVDMAGGLSNPGLAAEPAPMVEIATSIGLPLGGCEHPHIARPSSQVLFPRILAFARDR